MVVARDIAHAKLKERLDRGEGLPQYFKDHIGLLRRPGQDARGLRLGLVRPDHRRPHGLLRRPVPGARRQHGDARQGQPLAGGDRRLQEARRLLPGLDRRPGGDPGARTASRRSRCSSIRSSAWRRSGRSRSRTSRPSSSSTTRATTSSPRRTADLLVARGGAPTGPAAPALLLLVPPRCVEGEQREVTAVGFRQRVVSRSARSRSSRPVGTRPRPRRHRSPPGRARPRGRPTRSRFRSRRRPRRYRWPAW